MSATDSRRRGCEQKVKEGGDQEGESAEGMTSGWWMVDGEVCIGLFAIRDIKEVHLALPFATAKYEQKTATSTKIGSHAPAPSKLFFNSRFASRSTYHSDVEGKLGELTNESGGLTKQGDTAKQYLKLLVLTPASGGTVNGAAACSARDLSMLLEALLKTQRFSLVKDIMNKNGLQMFHNLLKQSRKSFEKRPILRKLLKVLDHLAKNRVLTVEHIYSLPRSGTEWYSSFHVSSYPLFGYQISCIYATIEFPASA